MKPKMVGTIVPYVEATITDGSGKVVWRGYDAPNPIARGLQALVAAGADPKRLTIREGHYPMFKRVPPYSADGHEYLTRRC